MPPNLFPAERNHATTTQNTMDNEDRKTRVGEREHGLVVVAEERCRSQTIIAA